MRSGDSQWHTRFRRYARTHQELVRLFGGGHDLAEFVEDFLSVGEEQAISVLKLARARSLALDQKDRPEER